MTTLNEAENLVKSVMGRIHALVWIHALEPSEWNKLTNADDVAFLKTLRPRDAVRREFLHSDQEWFVRYVRIADA